MESIDVRDLPEDQAQLIAAFVEFLRRKLREAQEMKEAEVQEREWSAGAAHPRIFNRLSAPLCAI